MTEDLAEARDELRTVARDLLRKADLNAGVEWQLLADAGWLGLEAPAVLGGADATFAELAVILEELGRAAARSPYLGVVVLGVGTLTQLEPAPVRDQLLRDVVSGAVIPAVALNDATRDGVEGRPPFRLERSSSGLRMHGSAGFVPDAPDAGRLLLLALDPDGVPAVVDAQPSEPGLSVTAQPVLDPTRRFGLVSADSVEVSEKSLWRFTGDPQAAARRLFDRAAVAVACDSLGLSEAMLAATVGYAKTREQFGRPIGSFQAVKHACADMLVKICVARQLVTTAAAQLAADNPEASVAVSMAKSYTCAGAVEVAGKAMQLHGGIGYTWESGIHVYLKRAALNRAIFGSPAAHRRRLAVRYQRQPDLSGDAEHYRTVRPSTGTDRQDPEAQAMLLDFDRAAAHRSVAVDARG
jgi:alkylation response protein AidB-like acyl-CoA dehydrogenase